MKRHIQPPPHILTPVQEFVGCYVLRSNVPLRPSVRDIQIFRSVAHQRPHFVFLIVCCNHNDGFSQWSDEVNAYAMSASGRYIKGAIMWRLPTNDVDALSCRRVNPCDVCVDSVRLTAAAEYRSFRAVALPASCALWLFVS